MEPTPQRKCFRAFRVKFSEGNQNTFNLYKGTEKCFRLVFLFRHQSLKKKPKTKNWCLAAKDSITVIHFRCTSFTPLSLQRGLKTADYTCTKTLMCHLCPSRTIYDLSVWTISSFVGEDLVFTLETQVRT